MPVLAKMGIDPVQRAKILVEDLALIGCDWPIRSTFASETVVLAHYEIPGTDFGKMDDDDASEVTKAHGSGLNWGSVVRLSKVCEVGRKYFGSEWPSKFKTQLLNPPLMGSSYGPGHHQVNRHSRSMPSNTAI